MTTAQKRPVSTALPLSNPSHHHHHHSQLQGLSRDRSGSDSIMAATTAAASSSHQHHQPLPPHHYFQERHARHQISNTSSPGNGTPPISRQSSSQTASQQANGNHTQPSSSSASASTSQSSNMPSISSNASAPATSFQPITLKQVMAAHGNDVNQALTGLLGNFNVALQDRESDKAEKQRLNSENSKLWNWANNLKREKESNMSEIRSLCARVVELEKILVSQGIAIPPPMHAATSSAAANLLSPSDSYTAIGDNSSDGNQRRPPTGPRSASDNGGTSRERQASNRSERERERSGTVTLPASHSVNSFMTASSMESSPSYTSSRDRDGYRRPRAGASTPPVVSTSKSLTPQSHNSPFMGGVSPGRSREASSNNPLPPLSSSASFSNVSSAETNPASTSQLQPGMVGLATIPSTPVVNNPERSISHEGGFTNSPTADAFHLSRDYNGRSDRERERSDSNSVEHLRIAKASPLPSSPALSSHSGSSSFRPSQHSGSQQPSPRSPRFAREAGGASSTGSVGSASPYIEGPTQGSPRHPNFHSSSQPRLPLNASSVSNLPQQQYSHSHPPPSSSNSRRTVSRKASSLDLGTDSKPSPPPIPSRSATPPPDLGSPKAPESPAQYAYKTPPANFESRFGGGTTPNSVNRAGMGVAQGTPMMDLPDEARNWILANGSALPSPVNSLDQRNERDRTAATLASQYVAETDQFSWEADGRPRISDVGLDSNLQPEAIARHRKISNVVHADLRNEGRASPASLNSSNNDGVDSSATAGVLQDAYEPSVLDESMDTATTLQAARPERTTSNNGERARGYATGSSQPPALAAQYASQPLPFRQGSDQGVTQLQQPPRPPHQRPRDDYGTPQAGAAPNYGRTNSSNAPAPKCVPLIPGLLAFISTEVVNSTIKAIDRGREAVVFHVKVAISKIPNDDPRHALVVSNAPSSWILEKTWIDLQNLDTVVRNKNSRSALRKVPSLPEKHLFKDHAPSRVDQRKTAVQRYLQGLCSEDDLSERGEVCAFLTSNIVSNRTAPVSNPGYKAGYLTKKGRNFGGWTTRYYVLSGRLLEYYDTPGGQHLGSIDIKAANIGRQNSKPSSVGDDAIRHAFLIRAKDKTGEDVDHILCAESDEERDHWVNMLVCCLTGEYVPDTIATTATKDSQPFSNSKSAPTASTNSKPPQPSSVDKLRQTQKKGSREIEILKGPAQPISQLSQDSSNQKLFGAPQYSDLPLRQGSQDSSKDAKHRREMSAGQSSTASGTDDGSSNHRSLRQYGLGSTLPGSASMPANLDQIANSDTQTQQVSSHRFARPVNATSQQENLADSSSSSRPKSPEKRMKISGPSGGMPIGADFKRSKEERRNKAKSSFWDFAGRRTVDRNATATPARPVFGVPIQEAVEIARVKDDSDLPAVVFRCVQYLSSVKAEREEGIYRMSGSSAVIKALKERFNADGDVDLTTEYFDPHAVAGLLKQFFRELPVHIFTAELNHDFIRANEIEDHRKKVKEVTRLVQQLPVANYSALRFLSAHLVNIIKCEHINKMGVKNMGIVFSPTLAVPATLFSLFINEFDRIFREIDIEEDDELEQEQHAAAVQSDTNARSRQRSDSSSGRARRRSRNSTLFTQSGADRLLESMGDGDAGEDAEEALFDPRLVERGHAAFGRANGGSTGHATTSGHTDEDTIRQHNRHKLTIDVTSAPSPARHPTNGHHGQPQKSPSAQSAASPRMLYPENTNALRSPGASPVSPRHGEGLLRKPSHNT